MHYPQHISVAYIVHLSRKGVLTEITGPFISNGMSEIFVNLRRLLILEVLARMELGISTAQGADQAFQIYGLGGLSQEGLARARVLLAAGHGGGGVVEDHHDAGAAIVGDVD